MCCPPKPHRFSPIFAAAIAGILVLLPKQEVRAMQVTGFSFEANECYTAGFPTAPIPNTNPAFVGAGRDWSGLAWNTNPLPSGFFRGVAMLSPRHFLTAQHFEYVSSEWINGLRVKGGDGVVSSVVGKPEIRNLGNGLLLTNYGNTAYDLAVGILTAPVALPDRLARTPVLDLHNSSSSDSLANYNNLPIFHTGRTSTANGSIRVATSSIYVTGTNSSDAKQAYFATQRAQVQLEVGDSGFPAYAIWTNPNGTPELALLGVNSAINSNSNLVSLLATANAMSATNASLNPEGFALRVAGNSSATWMGGSGNSAQRDDLNKGGNWGQLVFPSDRYVLFNGTASAYRSIEVNSASNLRGMYFRATPAKGDGFSFYGTATLTIGRGGVVNYDNDMQSFSANLSLGAPQFWDAGPGGIELANLNTNGHLLELRSPGASRITGVISGNGSLALESGNLTLSGNSTLSGTVWVHSGTLKVEGSVASASALRLAEPAVLRGSGVVSVIEGNGTVSPGAFGAILSASSLQPAQGLDFDFVVSETRPDYAKPTASRNDVLRLSGSVPFASSLSSSNRVRIFFDFPRPPAGAVLRAGFFTDQPDDFLDRIRNATFACYFADSEGDVEKDSKRYRAADPDIELSISTVAETVAFPNGTVSGRVLALEIPPDLSTYEGWAAVHLPPNTPAALRGPDADANGDGISNFLAFAMALPSNEPAAPYLPRIFPQAQSSGSEPHSQTDSVFVFEFRKNAAAADLVYEVETSTDLINWNVWSGTFEIVETNSNGATILRAFIEPPSPGTSGIFARLRVRAP